MAKKKTSKKEVSEKKTEAVESTAKETTSAPVLNSFLADKIAGKIDEQGNPL